MKKAAHLFLLIIIVSGCEGDLFDKDDPSVLEKDSFSEGIYMGYFVLRDQNYWCEIEFRSNKYEEWPSGGAYYQKEMSCLTTGTFSIDNTILKYNLDKYKFASFAIQCVPEMVLPGDYKIHLITMNDSLVFSKGAGKEKIQYHLIKVLK